MTGEVAQRKEELLSRMDRLDSIPSVAAILQPLVSYLQQPIEDLDVQRVTDLISHDNSLAAQCLHMANSPLFGRWQTITTTRGAVIALGLQRMRDIAVSCCVLKLLPGGWDENNPVVFWEHSLACALVARRVAKRIGMKDPEQAYMAGLMHDLGFVVNLRVMPDEFLQAITHARSTGCSVDSAEEQILGLTHCQTGKILAMKWELAPWLVDVIHHHHQLSMLSDYLPLVALINLSDRLCRMQGMGHGFYEQIRLNWETDESIRILNDACPIVRSINWPRMAIELVSYLKDVQRLVSVLYRFGN